MFDTMYAFICAGTGNLACERPRNMWFLVGDRTNHFVATFGLTRERAVVMFVTCTGWELETSTY